MCVVSPTGVFSIEKPLACLDSAFCFKMSLTEQTHLYHLIEGPIIVVLLNELCCIHQFVHSLLFWEFIRLVLKMAQKKMIWSSWRAFQSDFGFLNLLPNALPDLQETQHGIQVLNLSDHSFCWTICLRNISRITLLTHFVTLPSKP